MNFIFSAAPNNVSTPVKIDVSNTATYSNGNTTSVNGGEYYTESLRPLSQCTES